MVWVWRCYGLLWTLHCPNDHYYDVTMIWPLLSHGVHADVSETPDNALTTRMHGDYVDRFFVGFSAICYTFLTNNPIYIEERNCRLSTVPGSFDKCSGLRPSRTPLSSSAGDVMRGRVSQSLVIPPFHRGCDLCASLVRPQNWPGRRWRQKGGRAVALVVQGWHIGRSDIAMDAMVAGKFWACSKQSHKGRRGGRSLTGRSKEAGWRHTHRRGRRMDAQWSAIGRPVKKCEHCVSIWATRLLPLYHHCAFFGRPMASIERLLWRPLCLHSATTATLEPPWQWFCLHSAFVVRPVVPLQQCWSFKEGTGVVLQQLHRNRTFWVPATTERPNHFYGRTKVARGSQPCVKGA